MGPVMLIAGCIDVTEERTRDFWSAHAANLDTPAALLFEQDALTRQFLATQGCRIGTTAYVAPTALVGSNVSIGEHCFIYDFTCIRDGTILLDGVVVGHGTEIARSIVFSQSRLTHKVTISEAIIGRDVVLGANVCLAPVGLRDSSLSRRHALDMPPCTTSRSGIDRVGCVIGDGARLGMNSTAGPAAFIGRGCVVYPQTHVPAGQYPDRSVIRHETRLLVVQPPAQ